MGGGVVPSSKLSQRPGHSPPGSPRSGSAPSLAVGIAVPARGRASATRRAAAPRRLPSPRAPTPSSAESGGQLASEARGRAARPGSRTPARPTEPGRCGRGRGPSAGPRRLSPAQGGPRGPCPGRKRPRAAAPAAGCSQPAGAWAAEGATYSWGACGSSRDQTKEGAEGGDWGPALPEPTPCETAVRAPSPRLCLPPPGPGAVIPTCPRDCPVGTDAGRSSDHIAAFPEPEHRSPAAPSAECRFSPQPPPNPGGEQRGPALPAVSAHRARGVAARRGLGAAGPLGPVPEVRSLSGAPDPASDPTLRPPPLQPLQTLSPGFISLPAGPPLAAAPRGPPEPVGLPAP